MTTKSSTNPGAGAPAPATPPLPRGVEASARRVGPDALLDVPEACGLVPAEALITQTGPPPFHEASTRPPPHRRGRAGLFASAAAFGILAVLVLPRLAIVPDDDMAPSLLAGDLVVIGPGRPAAGEIVAVVDPLDPSRWTLRRVETVGGAIRYEAGVYLTGNAPRTLEMGRDDTYVTRAVDDHLVRTRAREVRWEMAPLTVSDDAAFLGADSRDDAMDSRWWGPFPLAAIQGRVILRLGAPGHPWRDWFTRAP